MDGVKQPGICCCFPMAAFGFVWVHDVSFISSVIKGEGGISWNLVMLWIHDEDWIRFILGRGRLDVLGFGFYCGFMIWDLCVHRFSLSTIAS